ncbi:MAG: glycosyltransferase, partial [Candidatus Shapirobacteria bacterium]|nr:glycosyltransferase [Candidatus Shapirobacteria bacterium]
GFAKAVNQGIRVARGKYVLLLNSDIRVLSGSIEKLIKLMDSKKDAGLVAPKLFNKDGRTSQASCYNLPTVGRVIQEFWFKKTGAFEKFLPRGGQPISVEAVVGAAMLIPKVTIDLIGDFDEKFFMYYEDLDFCRKIKKAGLKVYYVPQAKMIHHHGASGQKEPHKVNHYLVESSRKYHGLIKDRLINFLIKTSFYRKLIPLFLVIIGLLGYAVFPLLKFEFFASHDAFFHLIRLAEFDKAIRGGQIPPRWAPGLAGGLGAPVFNYFYPLSYYLAEALHLVGFSLASSVRLLFILGLIGGFSLTFLFLKRHFAYFASLLGAFFYIFAPYTFTNIYVRGNLPEFLALMILPGIFYFGEKIIFKKHPSSTAIFFFSLLLASFIMAHNIVSLWGVFWFSLYLLISAGKKAIKIIGPFLLGLGLSAFFWFPALLETSLVHLSSETVFNWWDHFPTLSQLVYSSWGYGVSLPGPGDTMSFQIGLPHLFLFLSALALVIICSVKRRIKLFLTKPIPLWLFIASSLGFVFLMNHRSAFLWQMVPFLSRVQFPWRFLGFLNFAIIFPITFLFNGILTTKKKLWVNLVVLVFLTASFGCYYSFPKVSRVLSEEKILTSSEATETTTNANEILPIWAPTDYYRYDFGKALSCQDFSCQALINLEEETEIVFAKFYFPSWQSNVGQTFAQKETGLTTIRLPQGKHDIKVYWQETKIQQVANITSLFSLIVVVGYGFLVKKKS